jgi:hypothetical protein
MKRPIFLRAVNMKSLPADLVDLHRTQSSLRDIINWIESTRQRPSWPQPTTEEVVERVEWALSHAQNFLEKLNK